jgi:hypothetical protein
MNFIWWLVYLLHLPLKYHTQWNKIWHFEVEHPVVNLSSRELNSNL